MDGTLVDSAEDIADAVNFTLSALGAPSCSTVEIKGFIGEGMTVLLEKALGTQDEKKISEATQVFQTRYLRHCVDGSKLYPGVRETLEAFQGRPMGISTNKPEAMTQKILDHFQISKHFRVVLGAESTKERKPHPEPILKFLAETGVSPGKTVIVGDGITDIQAGRSAGVQTCAVTYGYKSREELEAQKPDFFIDRVFDLRKFLC